MRGAERLESVVACAAERDFAQGASELEQLLAASVKRFGAELVRSDGDWLFARLSGKSLPLDHGCRAARCALALAKHLPEASLALVTTRGVRSVREPTAELAARAQAMTNRSDAPRAGAVSIDAATTKLLDARFLVEKSDQVNWLLGDDDSNDNARTLLGKPTSCVGRTKALELLAGVFDESAFEPAARLVVVTAKPGVGKSRLRYEFLRNLRTRHPDVEIWLGRGEPMSRGSPGSVIRRALHGQDLSRASFDEIVANECALRPLVLVLEDLHFCDATSIELVVRALHRAQALPFFVLALGRPEVAGAFLEISPEMGRVDFELPPLDRNSARQLVREALGKRARVPLTRRIVDQAAGNAFFLEELVRAVAGSRSTDSFPETPEAMAMTRLEALDPEARRLLQRASVFGEVFWERALVHLLEGDAPKARVAEWLDLLADQELVTRRRESRLNDEHELVFRHALLSEAAYASLGPDERRHAHRLAGEWLESVGEGDASLLAEHFERALEREVAVTRAPDGPARAKSASM